MSLITGSEGSNNKSGLVLVTVPIGNSADISIRAKDKLQDCSVIVAEDTRVIKELLKRLEIEYSDKLIISYHDHSAENSSSGVLKLMQEKEVVYVSDAGSPVISDPALPLIQLALANDIEVETLPGASAVMAAIELSGLPATPFHFHGFLPREKSKIQEFADLMGSQYGCHVFFEGVSRVKKTMDILCAQKPEWNFAICRELTKSFQSVYRFKGSDWRETSPEVVEKGEFVILAHNPDKKTSQVSSQAMELARQIMEEGAKPKLLSKLLAELVGMSPKEVYSKLKR